MNGQPPAKYPRATPTPTPPKGLVQQIIDEQKQQKVELNAALNRKSKRPKLGAGAVVVLVALNLVAWLLVPPASDSTGDRRSPSEVDRDLRYVVASAASQIDVWRRTHNGSLPASLEAAGVTDPGLTFVVVDSLAFEVIGEERGVKVTYHSNVTVSDFLDAGLGVKK